MFEKRQIVLPKPELCPELIDELEAYEYSVTEAGTIKTSAPGGQHDDMVVSRALCLAPAPRPAPMRDLDLAPLGGGEQPGRRGAEGLRQAPDDLEGRVPNAALDARDVGSIHLAGTDPKLLLRELQLLAPGAHRSAERLAKTAPLVPGRHGAIVGACGQEVFGR
jgi:hypothetical protein